MGIGSSKVSRDNLYDLLAVDRGSTNQELKAAYRQKALELHPDRNFEHEEEATAMFAKVQAAFDLLSNPDERHWYDQQQTSSNYTTYDGNVTPAATVRQVSLKELSKNQLDFEAITSAFLRIKQEEQEAAFESDMSRPAIAHAPGFGLSGDTWTQVKPFYDAWQGFSTIKTFAWEDIYPLNLATDRKTQKKWEQENKKIRDAAKREFNASIRQAVLLLRQRDPRGPAQKSTTKSAPKALQKMKASKATSDQHSATKFIEQSRVELETPSSRFNPSDRNTSDEMPDTDSDSRNLQRKWKDQGATADLSKQREKEDELVNGIGSLNMQSSPSDGKLGKTPGKLGKAKAKLNRKKQGQHILTCGTCGADFDGPALMEHKRITRHP